MCLALFSVSLIHPTGAIYLALLLLSHVLHGLALDNEEHHERLRRLAYIASAFITVGFAVALVVMAPRLFDEAVFSEYGWQGGKPLLVYNGVLLVVAAIAAFGLRTTLEGRIAITWFALLWVLSVVHLIEGLRNVPVLSLLSYTLYSMALHAYHVPLAVLVAWWMSPTPHSPRSEEATAPWSHATAAARSVVVALVLAGALGAQTVALSLASHEELLAVSPGDLVLEGRTGQHRWHTLHREHALGVFWNAPATVAVTSIPTLGPCSHRQQPTRCCGNASHVLRQHLVLS